VIVIGFIGQHLVAGSPLRNAAFMLLVIMLLGGFAITRQGEPPVAQASTVRYTSDGAYELIRVVDQPMANGVTKRVLWLDRSASSGVLLPSGAPAFGYMGYVDLLGIFPGAVSRALVLGAGTGVVAKSLYERYPDATIDIVDVEPKLFDLAHTYFALPDSPRIVTHVADGREFLRTSHTGYQVIFGDMYSTLFSVPWHVMTKEYYRRVYDSLDNGGVYMANIIGSLDVSTPSLFWSTVRTMRQVFDNVSVFAVDDPASNSVQNFILVAAKGTSVLDAVGTRDPASMSSYARLLVHAVNYDPNDLDLYDIFTDDRAPVGLYSVKLAEQRGL
jgi:spermidine synthase